MNLGTRESILAAAVAGSLAMAACGGGGSGGTSITSGVITGFGSVYVNGVEYDTTRASVSVEGAGAGESDLDVGMVVTVKGSINPDGTAGRATAISFTDELEGVVLTNDTAANGTLNIMGQRVTVSADTVFKNSSDDQAIATIADLQPDHVVEVSGHSDGKGEVFATRIELKKTAMEPGDEIEVKGVISHLDTAAGTFSLGGLKVDYGSANVPSLSDGLYVEAKSDSAPAQGDKGFTLAATEVEIEDDGEKGHDGEEGEEIELQGVVNDDSGLPDFFMLNGKKVLLGQGKGEGSDAAGVTTGDLRGRIVEVEGYFDGKGALVARELELEAEAELEFQGQVAAATDSSVTVSGHDIKITSKTRMVDERDAGGVTPVKYFSAADIAPGDYLEVDAYRDGTGALVATGVKRDDP